METKTVTVHARLAEETAELAKVCARNKGLSDSAFFRLAVEEAVRKYRPKHKVAGPEFVETEDIREAFAQDLRRMELWD